MNAGHSGLKVEAPKAITMYQSMDLKLWPTESEAYGQNALLVDEEDRSRCSADLSERFYTTSQVPGGLLPFIRFVSSHRRQIGIICKKWTRE